MMGKLVIADGSWARFLTGGCPFQKERKNRHRLPIGWMVHSFRFERTLSVRDSAALRTPKATASLAIHLHELCDQRNRSPKGLLHTTTTKSPNIAGSNFTSSLANPILSILILVVAFIPSNPARIAFCSGFRLDEIH